MRYSFLVNNSYRWVILGVTTAAQTTVSVLSQGIAPLAPFIQSDYSLIVRRSAC